MEPRVASEADLRLSEPLLRLVSGRNRNKLNNELLFS